MDIFRCPKLQNPITCPLDSTMGRTMKHCWVSKVRILHSLMKLQIIWCLQCLKDSTIVQTNIIFTDDIMFIVCYKGSKIFMTNNIMFTMLRHVVFLLSIAFGLCSYWFLGVWMVSWYSWRAECFVGCMIALSILISSVFQQFLYEINPLEENISY